MTEKKEFFQFISLLRGFAALLVVWSHLVGWWLNANKLESPYQYYWENTIVKPFHLYQNGGHLGVVLFFLISGYVITHVSLSETTKEFIIKRVLRIFPTLFIALLITAGIVSLCVYFGLMLPLGTGERTVEQYIYSFLLLNIPLGMPAALSVTWTLAIEIIFYVLTAIFLMPTKKNALTSTYLFCLITSLTILFSPYSQLLKETAYLLVYIFILLIGRVYYFGVRSEKDKSKYLMLGVLNFVFFSYFYDYLYPGRFFSIESGKVNYPLIYTYAIALCIFIISSQLYYSRTKVGSFFSDISYSLYLIHLPVGCFVLAICHVNKWSFELSVIVAFIICFILSKCMYEWIEKPLQNLARKWCSHISVGRSIDIQASNV
ncbi:acyltransferase family protein [Aeromonas bestiarum]|uniref:acyltransferase family protein n=1 Tax=Aeromonas bestiarum TaxID=105751 RepID=UPI000A7E3A18|nr:acyltransferase [Aeromonas bestiarum]